MGHIHGIGPDQDLVIKIKAPHTHIFMIIIMMIMISGLIKGNTLVFMAPIQVTSRLHKDHQISPSLPQTTLLKSREVIRF